MPVYIASSADLDDNNGDAAVVHRVDQTKVTDTDPVAVSGFDLLVSVRPRVYGQSLDRGSDPLPRDRVQFPQFFAGKRL